MDLTVNWNSLARFHHDQVADFQLLDRHDDLSLTVSARCFSWRQLSQSLNCIARSIKRPILESMPQAEEREQQCPLGELSQGCRAQSSCRHQQVGIEMPVAKGLERMP